MLEIPSPLPAEGLSIPLRASFGGLKKWLPRALGFSHNNASPVLRLHADHVVCKVVRTVRRPYAEIERVDVLRSFGTHNLIIDWRGSLLNFAANLRQPEDLRQVLRFLDARHVPLSAAARSFMEEAS
jgi:hypothetical protein